MVPVVVGKSAAEMQDDNDDGDQSTEEMISDADIEEEDKQQLGKGSFENSVHSFYHAG